MTAPARTAAYHALRDITAGRADLPAALARSREFLRDDRDRSLTAEIVTGALRWQRSLDHLIPILSSRALDRLDREVVVILRLSLYQLLHLDRVPASAVVDDAVNLAREARKPSAAGFVNAVLRSMLRQRHRLPLPARPGDGSDRAAALAYLGVTCSHPEWLVARWLDRYGFDATERWVRFNNDVPPLTVRVNRLLTTKEGLLGSWAQEGIEAEPTRFASDGLTITAGNPLRTSSDRAFVVQDESSQLVPLMIGAQPGERVLDLCAAPGGKTTAMAADMRDSGTIVACDIRAKRLALLRDTVRTSGAHCIEIAEIDAAGPLPFTEPFDRVLVDAPCSGLGTIRRDPDVRWRRQASDLAPLATAQLQLLERAAAVVAIGGRLVYATCSSEPEENEMVIERFLEGHHDYAVLNAHGEIDSRLHSLLDRDGMLRTLPSEHKLEAFFAAALVRR